MKIAYFINEYPKVSHSFIRREIVALEKHGFDVQRIALRGWDGPLPDEDDQRERERTDYVLRKGFLPLFFVTVRTFARTPIRFVAAIRLALTTARTSDRPLFYHLVYLAEACAILPRFIAFGSTRVHAHFGTNSTDVVMLARQLGGPPYSFTVHGPEEFSRAVNLAEKIRRSAFVAAVSSFGRSQLWMQSSVKDWSKIHVVHCGLEDEFSLRVPLAPCTAPRLICVGRLTEAKGHLLLLQAAASVIRKGLQLELVLAGDGPLRMQLEAAVSKFDLAEHVRITGWISGVAVRREMLASRALVLPSFAEGLPVVIMEAMALRRPVLTTYVAGIPELVQHGRTGWLFPAGAEEPLIAAMEDCLRMPPDKLQAMGEQAHQRVMARHSIDTEASKLARLLRTHDWGNGNVR